MAVQSWVGAMVGATMAAAIGLRRIAQQRLAGQRFSTPEAVVGWLGAVQAQDYPGALWSLGQRMDGATAEGIERAFD
ncbi:MAG: hypothetical protein ACRDHE_04905, partial [Ktedonobacterales bacterium]